MESTVIPRFPLEINAYHRLSLHLQSREIKKTKRREKRGWEKRRDRFKGVSIKATLLLPVPGAFTRLQLYVFNRKWPRATAFKLGVRKSETMNIIFASFNLTVDQNRGNQPVVDPLIRPDGLMQLGQSCCISGFIATLITHLRNPIIWRKLCSLVVGIRK